MKRCSICGGWLPFDKFYSRPDKPDGLSYDCRDCKKRYNVEHYRRTKSKYRESRAASRERLKAEGIEFLYALLSRSHCQDCGTIDLRVLEFDHVRGEKVGNVTVIARTCGPGKKLVDEIAKCEIVCANCHRIRTCERAGSWRTLIDN